MSQSELVERLADALIGAVPTRDPGVQAVGLALLRTLATGEPVSEQALAAASGTPEPTIRDALESWPGVFRDEDERVVGFMGLSVAELGEHRIEVGGRTLTAWCRGTRCSFPSCSALRRGCAPAVPARASGSR